MRFAPNKKTMPNIHVMAGLGPGHLSAAVDGRVKPGHDAGGWHTSVSSSGVGQIEIPWKILILSANVANFANSINFIK